jgi:predicted histone-like DNA-binding protein
MIDYSVYMMTPTYSKDETPKAYAKNQVSEIWSLEKFAKHISDHNGVYSRGTVKGVISDMCECLVEQLLNGNKIQLGELGTFGISISSEGAESIEKFASKNIKAVNILFSPGADFENLIGRAEFNPVASRIAQKATLKAEKAGEATVDLEAAKNKVNAGGSQSTNEDEEDDSTGTGSTTVTPGTGGGGSSEDGGEE